MNKMSSIKVTLRYILLVAIAIIALFPIFWVISNSLKTLNGISQ